jgi:hypothetical protein
MHCVVVPFIASREVRSREDTMAPFWTAIAETGTIAVVEDCKLSAFWKGLN